jgi:hypothetical protein
MICFWKSWRRALFETCMDCPERSGCDEFIDPARTNLWRRDTCPRATEGKTYAHWKGAVLGIVAGDGSGWHGRSIGAGSMEN